MITSITRYPLRPQMNEINKQCKHPARRVTQPLRKCCHQADNDKHPFRSTQMIAKGGVHDNGPGGGGGGGGEEDGGDDNREDGGDLDELMKRAVSLRFSRSHEKHVHRNAMASTDLKKLLCKPLCNDTIAAKGRPRYDVLCVRVCICT